MSLVDLIITLMLISLALNVVLIYGMRKYIVGLSGSPSDEVTSCDTSTKADKPFEG